MLRMMAIIVSSVSVFAADAGEWKTWVPNMPATRGELQWIRGVMPNPDPRIAEQIRFWDSGPSQDGARTEVLARLFPERAASDFEIDVTSGETLGRNVAGKFIEWAKNDGAEVRP